MDLARIREDARRTSTENLLDRVTVYRGEMESPAVEVIESELKARGVSNSEVEAHAAMRERDGLLRRPDGSVVRCNFCPRPATAHRWRWHRLWGWFLPLIPRFFHLCKEHDEQLPTDAYGRTLHYDADPGGCREGPAV
jgi:hypothetical protein